MYTLVPSDLVIYWCTAWTLYLVCVELITMTYIILISSVIPLVLVEGTPPIATASFLNAVSLLGADGLVSMVRILSPTST